jgi:hypothetical protein
MATQPVTPTTEKPSWMDTLESSNEQALKLELENAHLWAENSILRVENKHLMELLQRALMHLSRSVKPSVDKMIEEMRLMLSK